MATALNQPGIKKINFEPFLIYTDSQGQASCQRRG